MVRIPKGLCPVCGRITPQGRRYCTERHRLDAWNARRRDARAVKRETVTCAKCGTVFEPKRSTATFCSVKCRVAAHRSGKVAAAKRKAEHAPKRASTKRNAKRLRSKSKPRKVVTTKRHALLDVVMAWLDKTAGIRYVGERFEKCPGVDAVTLESAISELVAARRALYVNVIGRETTAPQPGKECCVATRQSLANGIKSIEASQAKGELGTGVAVGLGAIGSKQAYARANAATIRQYKALIAKLKP